MIMTAIEILAVILGAALGWATGSVSTRLHVLRRPPASHSEGQHHCEESSRSPVPVRTGANGSLEDRLASRVGMNPRTA